jgi:hypothetical protein
MEGTSPTSDSNTDRGQREATNGRSEERPKDEASAEQNAGLSASNSMPAPPAASSGSVQTKVVQTAFIHKLYR